MTVDMTLELSEHTVDLECDNFAASSDVGYNAGYFLGKTDAVDALRPELDEIRETAENAETIAKGRATGYVFDTVEDLDLWLKDAGNRAKLVLGDNLYIRATDVPDYWWDGTSKQMLESQKVDLNGYVKNTDYVGPGRAGLCSIPDFSTGGYGLVKCDQTLVPGGFTISPAGKAEIDKRESRYKPIVPYYLDYAVKKCLVASNIEWTEAEKQVARDLLGAIGSNLGAHKIPYTDSKGNLQTLYDWSSDAIAWTFPVRREDGQILVGEPTLVNAATTKDYVDRLVGDIATALDEIIAIQNGLIGGGGE